MTEEAYTSRSSAWHIDEDRATAYDDDAGYQELMVLPPLGERDESLPLIVGFRGHPYQSKKAQAKRLASMLNGLGIKSDGQWSTDCDAIRVLRRILAAHELPSGAANGQAVLCPELADLARAAIAKAEGGAA